ncbi:hypothetical protein IE81DRAFT_339788 [Ceraceosorus guamensis]|uniref:Uncharacterized protein n=1 Tax=Ceraceosorus guamensis TaxID=1522189 RepID=A0A316W4P3_9BASI|nr:hypothetical protein IE81DRAFT_339788 [Ceraceosorus guamensis]PWN44886.1 hypothetical protein IE81DRAFT_339788 [Ceraceosorus guamensis]
MKETDFASSLAADALLHPQLSRRSIWTFGNGSPVCGRSHDEDDVQRRYVSGANAAWEWQRQSRTALCSKRAHNVSLPEDFRPAGPLEAKGYFYGLKSQGESGVPGLTTGTTSGRTTPFDTLNQRMLMCLKITNSLQGASFEVENALTYGNIYRPVAADAALASVQTIAFPKDGLMSPNVSLQAECSSPRCRSGALVESHVCMGSIGVVVVIIVVIAALFSFSNREVELLTLVGPCGVVTSDTVRFERSGKSAQRQVLVTAADTVTGSDATRIPAAEREGPFLLNRKTTIHAPKAERKGRARVAAAAKPACVGIDLRNMLRCKATQGTETQQGALFAKLGKTM